MKKIFTIILFIILICPIAFADTLTKDEIIAANKVYYISNREFFYYEKSNDYIVRFCLMDKNKNRMASPCHVSVRLVNSDGNEVYMTTRILSMDDNFLQWTWSSLYSDRNGIYASIYIHPDEIQKSKHAEGKMFIKVWQDGYFSFDEYEVDVKELPLIESTLSIPELPCKVAIKKKAQYIWGTVYESESEITISDITYEFRSSSLDIYITAEMTVGGVSTGKQVIIEWRLLDDEGYVVKTGRWYTDSLYEGEKFKNKKFTIYPLDPGNYTLRFLDTFRN